MAGNLHVFFGKGVIVGQFGSVRDVHQGWVRGVRVRVRMYKKATTLSVETTRQSFDQSTDGETSDRTAEPTAAADSLERM